ncbi:MAG: methylmalonyl Co-A mutase-associated GTPase MeaB [Chloroflexi bacterium]|nr:methylmalonyl Co-A mutase-associated GTPase MeaB [Chloroflexota bacterium]
MKFGELVSGIKKGDRLALGKALSIIENEDPGSLELLAGTGDIKTSTWTVGITGPPGSGKSTLLDKLIKLIRDDGKSIGVLAVDPTSPFSGGAILGDRIRMQRHTTDNGVFIRSMASRGSRGGLALHSREAACLMRAFGFDYLFIETVGTGQLELDVMSASDTCIVLQTPGSGDDIQMIKAGILEIGDIYVVNRADHECAVEFASALSNDLESRPLRDGWSPPVMLTVAIDGTGVPAVLHAIEEHKKHMLSLPDRKEKEEKKLEEELLRIMMMTIESRLKKVLPGRSEYRAVMEKLASCEIDPYSASKILTNLILKEDFNEPA